MDSDLQSIQQEYAGDTGKINAAKGNCKNTCPAETCEPQVA
jgi:hypothetical protein